MAVLRGRLQCVAVFSSLSVDVSPFLKQEPDDLVVAQIRSRTQRITILSALCVDIGPLLEQPLHDLFAGRNCTFGAEPRTNTLLVYADEATTKSIRAVVKELDVPSTGGKTP